MKENNSIAVRTSFNFSSNLSILGSQKFQFVQSNPPGGRGTSSHRKEASVQGFLAGRVAGHTLPESR